MSGRSKLRKKSGDIRKGDKVLGNFIGGLEEAKVKSIRKSHGGDLFTIQSKKRPKDKALVKRRDIRNIYTGI